MTTLTDHISALNAKSAAWVAEDPTNRFSSGVIEDLSFWAGYGITTVEQFIRHELEGGIWDLYKSVHGIRPRWMDFKAMTVEELQKCYDELGAESTRQFEEEKAFEEKHGYSTDELEDIFYRAADESAAMEAAAVFAENMADREEEFYHNAH